MNYGVLPVIFLRNRVMVRGIVRPENRRPPDGNPSAPLHGMDLLRAMACAITALPLLAGSAPEPARVEMQGVHFRFDESLILEIHYLQGKMTPAQGSPLTAVFDDPRSFTIEIEAAEIAISTASLTHLLNTYVFSDKKSPLKELKVTAEAGRIKQEGKLDKAVDVPFKIEGELEPTPDGKIRIRPTGIKAAHVPVKGLMDLFGVHVADLINTKHARGVTINKDDIILDPERMLPPPQMKGRSPRCVWKETASSRSSAAAGSAIEPQRVTSWPIEAEHCASASSPCVMPTWC